jgi:hypothetical protein
MMAPFVDRALELSVTRLGFKSKQQTFLVFLAFCISIALTIFGIVVLAWQ